MDAAVQERLTGLIAQMLAELRGGAAPPVSLDDELERGLGIDSLARSRRRRQPCQLSRMRRPSPAPWRAATRPCSFRRARSRALRDCAFHLGAFAAAAESGRPVVPVTLRGTRSVLRDGGWRETLRLRHEARRAILADCGEPDAAAR